MADPKGLRFFIVDIREKAGRDRDSPERTGLDQVRP